MDTADGRALAAGLWSDGRVLGRASSEDRTAGDRLAVEVRDLLEGCGVDGRELDGVVLSGGPGSYTGLRVGFSVGKALCYAWRLPLAAVSTLRSIARGSSWEGPVCAAVPARRGSCCAAVYGPPAGGDPSEDREVLFEGAVIPVGELGDLAERFRGGARPPLIACGGSWRPGAGDAAGFDVRTVRPEERIAPLAELGLALLERGEDVEPLEAVPVYMSRSSAEIQWERRGSRRGGMRP